VGVTARTQLFVDLVRVETRLYNLVDARLRGTHGVTLGQVQTMQGIARRGTCRVQDLAEEVDITVGAMSKAVDRLEAAGWCVRSANPDDRRSSLLSLTEEGARVLAAAVPTFDDEVARQLSGVPGDALDGIATTLAALRRTLERASRAS
jgi:DNA-binding MarR family transcriptional regulator